MKRAGHDVGRDQVGRLIAMCGVVRGRRRTVNTERDERAPRQPDLIERQWGVPPSARISGGTVGQGDQCARRDANASICIWGYVLPSPVSAAPS